MNIGIGNNEVTQSYYDMSLADKRIEFYNEFIELVLVLKTLIGRKKSDANTPGVESFDNLSNPNIDENLYMTGLYEDFVVLKEMIAYLLDDEIME